MPLRILTTTASALLMTQAALAAPEDFLDHIPHSIIDMEMMDYGMHDGEFVAYYGETIGRATLRIFSAPEADADGENADRRAISGATPAAQRALLDLLSRNLAEGTGALGDGYVTDPVRLFSVNVDGADTLEGSLACGFIRREQSEERAGDDEPMVLSDRVCLTQHGDDVLAVSITTPHRPESMRQDMNEAQISFSGMLIGAIVREAAEPGEDD